MRHRREGLKYVYVPTLNSRRARTSALRHVVETFFGGSPQAAVAALLDMPDLDLPARDRQRLAQMVRKARQEGR